MPVYRHTLLPDAVCLLQLCQPGNREKHEADRTLPGCTDTGNSGQCGAGQEKRPARRGHLCRRGNAYNPVRIPYSVEAGRPDTITEEKLLVLRRHGVDRVSVNPQTMRDEVLEAIGRKHTAGDILEALEKVRKVGGFAVNMDLIAGLPKDDPEGFAKSLEQVLALKPENITIHTLSLKRGSTLMSQPGIIPTAAEVGRMLDNAYRRLNGEDYAPYYLYRQKNMSGGFENTGWTKQGYENLYNICMMEELCSILASGGGGSTKLIHPEGGKNIRITAPKYPLEYIQQIEKTCEEKRRIGEFYEYDVRSR